MIEIRRRRVFWSSARGRHFFSRAAAVRAEVDALIRRKHPDEKFEPETGHSFYWRDDLPRAQTLERRVRRLVEAALAKFKEPGQ